MGTGGGTTPAVVAPTRLDPDLVDRLSRPGPDGVRLVVTGGAPGAAGDRPCPGAALVPAATPAMRLRHDDVLIVDTHAGVGCFDQELARGFDTAVVVVDPTVDAVREGLDAARRAADLGIDVVHLVVNRTRTDADIDRVLATVGLLGGFGFDSVTALPYDAAAPGCGVSVDGLFDGSVLVDAVIGLAMGVLSAGVLTAGRDPVGAPA